jgi:hypothetical protein
LSHLVWIYFVLHNVNKRDLSLSPTIIRKISVPQQWINLQKKGKNLSNSLLGLRDREVFKWEKKQEVNKHVEIGITATVVALLSF